MKEQSTSINLVAQMEELRAAHPCSVAGMTSAELISAFGNDTQMTLAMGKALLRHGVEHVAESQSPCKGLPQEEVEALEQQIGPLAADERMLPGRRFLTKWGAWSLTLATAYHKIVPMCQQSTPNYARALPDNWLCGDLMHPSEPDGKIVYDLVPIDKERGYCYGEPCRQAVRAIDRMRAYLHTFSHFRMRVIHSMLSNVCPFSGDGAFLRELLTLNAELPSLMTALRGASDGLQPTCVAPSRASVRTIESNWEQAKVMLAVHKHVTDYPDAKLSKEELRSRLTVGSTNHLIK